MPSGEPLLAPRIREDVSVEDPKHLGPVLAAQAAEFAEAVVLKYSPTHPQAKPFLHALFPDDDDAVRALEAAASVGFLVAELDRARGWSRMGQIDRRVQSVFTYRYPRDVARMVTAEGSYFIRVFVAEAAYYYARVGAKCIDALRRTATAFMEYPFFPSNLREMQALLQSMAPGSDNGEAQRSLVELLELVEYRQHGAVSKYLPVTRQIAQGTWVGDLDPNLRQAMQEVAFQLASFDA